MKKSVTKIVKATLGLTMAIGAGVGVVTSNNKTATRLNAANDISVTFPGSPSAYTNNYSSSFSITSNNITFTFANWNNGTQNNAWTIIRGGSKNNAWQGTITSSQISSEVQSVVVAVSQTTEKGGGASKLEVATNSSFTDGLQTISKSADSTAGNKTYTIPVPTANCYYRLTHNSDKGDANGEFRISSITINYATGGDIPEPTGYTVSFDANGGTGSMNNVSNVEGTYSLPSNGFAAPSGKAFIGWKANNEGNLITVPGNYNVTADVTFYAQWEDRYTVKYYANGGTGSTITDPNGPYAPNATVTVKDSAGFTAPFADMVFEKWNTAADGSGQDYAPNATFNISANTNLYAQWIDDPNIPYTNVYSTGFESSENFTSSTDYMSEKDDGPSGKQWHIYYGTASTGSPLSNGQSLQMRWYGNYKDNLPHAETLFHSKEVKRVTFKYKVSNSNLDFKVQYNTNGSDSWTDIETVNTADNNVRTYRHIFNSAVSSFYFRILCVAGETAPASGKNYEFRIDNLSIDSIATPSTINGNNSVTSGSEWAPTSITEDVGGALVTGATFTFEANDGAVISSSNNSTGAFVCSSAGTVVVSATKSGYLISDKTVTVVPAESYINNLSKTSVSGFTGQNETITFSYGNLSGVLTVESNNSSVVTVSDLSQSAGTGSVQLNYVGAGSTTVSFKDGSTEKASVTVTVATSSVTISGMPSSKILANNSTFNLEGLISVEATGSCSNDIAWSSSNGSIVSVNASGVVTSLSLGSAVITATPDDYPEAAVSCTVIVTKAVGATFGVGLSEGTTAAESGDDIESTDGYVIDSNIEFSDLAYVYPKTGQALKFGGSSAQASITVGLKNGKVGGNDAYITRIIVRAIAYNTDTTTISIGGEDKLLTSSFADYVVDFDTKDITAVTISASGASKQRFRIAYIDIVYDCGSAKDAVKAEASTESILAYHYSKENDNPFVFSNVVLRFGGFISVDLWDDLAGECDINGFGIMYADAEDLAGDLIKDWYDIALDEANGDIDAAIASLDSFIGNSYVELSPSKTHPGLATTNQKIELGVDSGDSYYMWNHREIVSSEDLEKEFTAVAYIRINDELVFFQETTKSAKQVALDLLDNGIYEDDAFDGSLYALAHLND